MKKLIFPIAFASVILFAACNTKPEEPQRDMIMLNDAQNQSSLNSDTAATTAIEPEEQAPPAPVATPAPRTYREPVVRQTKTVKPRPTPVYKDQTTTPPVVVATPAPALAPIPSETNTAGSATTGDETGTTDEKTTAKKGGLSKGAQGAIIGGVGGAVGGAVIGKNGKGAVIGGIIGAAGGYILGRQKDKKESTNGGN